MNKKKNLPSFKIKVWDEFGMPIHKVKGSSKDITKKIKSLFKKYD